MVLGFSFFFCFEFFFFNGIAMFEICIHVQGLALVVFLALMYQTEQEDGILSFESSVFFRQIVQLSTIS